MLLGVYYIIIAKVKDQGSIFDGGKIFFGEFFSDGFAGISSIDLFCRFLFAHLNSNVLDGGVPFGFPLQVCLRFKCNMSLLQPSDLPVVILNGSLAKDIPNPSALVSNLLLCSVWKFLSYYVLSLPIFSIILHSSLINMLFLDNECFSAFDLIIFGLSDPPIDNLCRFSFLFFQYHEWKNNPFIFFPIFAKQLLLYLTLFIKVSHVHYHPC